ncbi:MAG: hypothetical protein JNL67_20820 [Planctomycetaceae bacterium]|nr:hypothetical protein [Planctomycetaceae bacterium]
MENDQPITQWIDGLRQGDDESVRRIWESLFDRLLQVARKRLKSAKTAAYDEEDVVVSAFKSFCLGVRLGRYPKLQSREDLWRLLFVITSRKVADQFVFQQREKRDARREVVEADMNGVSQHGNTAWFLSKEPTPQFAAECADQLRFLLAQLQHEDLKRVAILKMEGYTNPEISEKLGRSLTTIERKLRTIREIWSQSEA